MTSPNPQRRAWAHSLGGQKPAEPPQSLPSEVTGITAAEGPGATPSWRAEASAQERLLKPSHPGEPQPPCPSSTVLGSCPVSQALAAAHTGHLFGVPKARYLWQRNLEAWDAMPKGAAPTVPQP